MSEKTREQDRWWRAVSPQWFFALWPVILAVTAVILAPMAGCSNRSSGQVVVYTSQDQVYAEPILRDFTKETGIRVKAVYDSEAVKTVGLVNRLIAEKRHPQCDVFWNNEELRTRQLARQDLFRETNGWVTAGYRARELVINTNLLSLEQAPRSLIELTNPVWRGKVAFGYPLFGTTATHFAALRQQWGEEGWLEWCRALTANQSFLVDGNSVVVKLVGRGEAWIGMTDSDDIAAAQREGFPVAAVELSSDGLLIANSMAVIRNARHPEPAQALVNYLQREDVLRKLVEVDALAGIAKPDGAPEPDWDALLGELESTATLLQGVFLR